MATTRTTLTPSLQTIDARELRGFLRRAIRENDPREAAFIREEYARRGVRLKRVDYHQAKRVRL
jgi:hypothetical protein